MRRFVTPFAMSILFAACSGEPADDHTLIAGRAPEPASPSTFVTPSTAAPEAPTSETGSAASVEPAAADPAPPAAEPAAPARVAPAKTEPGHVSLDALLGRIDPAKDPAFARIPDKYVTGSRVWGHKDAVGALGRMIEAAAANGYKLHVVSAFRSFDDQKQIWDDKWTGKTPVEKGKLPKTIPDPKARALKILEFSAMPGTSRHHWGTDFDLNSLSNSYFKSGEGKRVYDWLTQHAAEYGFCQPYTAKGADRPKGYEEEKWHWSYMPVATWYLEQYPAEVGYERLAGFEGAAVAKDIDVIANYVQGISPDCK